MTNTNEPIPINKPAGLTSLTPMLRYRVQEANGQVHVGYFLPDPKDHGKLKIVARTQHRNRVVADGHMVNRALTTAGKMGKPWLQLVFTNETGAYQAYDTEAAAIEAAAKSELPCVLYRPDGTWDAL
jgi:hypothetical protein